MTISSLIFSLLQLGLFSSQIVLFRKYRSEEMVRFILMTVLFIILNITLLSVSIHNLDIIIFKSINALNSITIATYLFFLNFEPLLSNKSRLRKTPWFFVAVAIAFGIHGLIFWLPTELGNLKRSLFFVIPILLGAKFLTLFLVKLQRSLKQMVGWFGLFLIAIIIVGSFKKYVESTQWASYFIINILFLLFASIQYWSILSATKNDISKNYDVSDENCDVSELEKYSPTPTELKIAKYILKGYNYEQIAEIRFRSYTSVSSQASNLFKKVGVKSKEEFIEKFSHLSDIQSDN